MVQFRRVFSYRLLSVSRRSVLVGNSDWSVSVQGKHKRHPARKYGMTKCDRRCKKGKGSSKKRDAAVAKAAAEKATAAVKEVTQKVTDIMRRRKKFFEGA